MTTHFPKRLKINEVVPYLRLPSNRHVDMNLWDLKQKRNLVIFFYHGIDCKHCAVKLKELDQAYDNVTELEAEILAVSFDNLSKLRDHAQRTGIRFHLLSDQTGETTETFTCRDNVKSSSCPSIFITDRFGGLRYQKIASEADELPSKEEILSWLLLIQSECPECSHL